MKHALSFRGEHHAIPAGLGLCTTCGAFVTMEQWLDATCPGRLIDVGELCTGDDDMEATNAG